VRLGAAPTSVGQTYTLASNLTDGPQIVDAPSLFQLTAIEQAALQPPREVQVSLNGLVSVGQSYPLSSAGASGSATVYYLQSENTAAGIDSCWVASSGTLFVSSRTDCVLDFAITGASMAPTSGAAGSNCAGANNASGTFTLAVTGMGDGVSQ
jgi:hypothetical protein